MSDMIFGKTTVLIHTVPFYKDNELMMSGSGTVYRRFWRII